MRGLPGKVILLVGREQRVTGEEFKAGAGACAQAGAAKANIEIASARAGACMTFSSVFTCASGDSGGSSA